ncbi:MAG: TonB-dependent receptor [Bacteroidales bacterium]|nr:TonB-dependent receptor [Bacteroidales bacterium]
MKKLIATTALCSAAMMSWAQVQDTIKHDEVVITGTRETTLLRNLPVTVTVIGHEELVSNYQTSLLPSVMEHTPGMFTTSRGMIGYGVSTNAAGSIKVRGVGSGAALLVLIDGQPQYAGLMGHPIPDAYQGMNAERVEVLRGPSSVLYGSNAMGGVVNIVTRNAKEEGISNDILISAGSYGTMQLESGNRFKKDKLQGVVNLNYQRTDGHTANSNFDQVAGYVKLGYEISNNWKTAADINLTNFGFMNPGPENAPLLDAEADITRGLASVSVSNSYGKTDGMIRAFYDWGHHDINDGHTADKPDQQKIYKHDDFIGGVNVYQNVRFLPGNNVTFGFDYQTFGGKAWNEAIADGSKTYIGEYENPTEVAGYVDIRQAIAGIISLDFGLRVNNHSVSGTEIVPQGGVAFHFPQTQDVKLLVSKGFRNPIIREMYMFPPQNPNLEPERMMNYELSYRKRHHNGTFGFNLFLIDGENLIVTAPNPSGAGKLNQNIGEFRNHGFELEGAYRFAKWWSVNANYSYLHMKTPVVGAPESKMDISANYTHGKWSATASIEDISGLYITTGDDAETENYTLVNMTMSYEVAKFAKVFVRGENLLAERYQTYEGFWMPKATFMGGIKMRF